MVKFYTNRELSHKLGINLARWKRWSREFLRPDPLAGMQSGYARQYYPDEAFTVNLGGYLVSELHYTIPEAKQILQDLNEWLPDKGFNFYAKGDAKLKEEIDKFVKEYNIFIIQKGNRDFFYTVRGVISNQQVDYKGFQVMKELYVETSIPQGSKETVDFDKDNVKMLNITGVLTNFTKKLGIS